MNISFKNMITLLLLFFTTLTFTACMEKQANGKYASHYSFHPYYDLYPNKMIGEKRSYTPTKTISKRTSTHSHKVAYNDENLYPSNLPVDNY